MLLPSFFFLFDNINVLTLFLSRHMFFFYNLLHIKGYIFIIIIQTSNFNKSYFLTEFTILKIYYVKSVVYLFPQSKSKYKHAFGFLYLKNTYVRPETFFYLKTRNLIVSNSVRLIVWHALWCLKKQYYN